jgi:hypothetical protein
VRFLLAALAFAALGAEAQAVLFKWTDAQGRVHYGDRLPKGHTGPFERVDTEGTQQPPGRPQPPAEAPAVPAAPPAPVTRPAAPKPDAMMDIAARRRATRERLQADVDAAKERLAQAEEALRSGGAPGDDERQVIQQVAGAPGTLPAAGRSNCRKATNAQGKQVTMCPAVIPNTQYYDRMKGLEDAVKAAQADLDRAREAYRRGVD